MILEEVNSDMMGSYQYESYENDPALNSSDEKFEKSVINPQTKTDSFITYNGKKMETLITGSKKASSGIVMSAYVPEIGGRVFHRRFGSGKQGFHFGDGGEIPNKHKNLLQLTF